MRSRTRRWLAVIVAAWIGSAMLPASGASIDDPPFAQGPLDLKRLIATKHDATAPLHLTLVTYEGWDASILDVSGSNRIFVLFDPDRSGQQNFRGEIFRRDGDLWMWITKPNGEFVRRVRAFHPEGKHREGDRAARPPRTLTGTRGSPRLRSGSWPRERARATPAGIGSPITVGSS